MKNVLVIAANSQYSHSSLALRYFREYANCNIFECSINDSIFDIYAKLSRREENIFCFSVYIWNVEYIKKLAPMIKAVRPDVQIIFGGPEAGYNHQELLDALPYLDAVMVGEGEDAIYALEKGEDYALIPNLVWRNEKEIIQNPLIKTELSKIPFPYNKADLYKLKNKIIYFEASRGCLFQCSYCLSSSEGKTRFFPMEYVLKGLKFFIENRVPLVKFVDRTFNENQDRALQIVNFISKNNICTQFHFEIAPQLLTDEFLEAVAKTNGLIQFEMGIQTTNPKTMKEIRRVYDLKLTREKILSIPPNVHIHLDLIAGLPHETIETFADGFRYVYNMHPQMLQLGFLKLLHNTRLKNDAVLYDIKTTNFPPYEVLSTSTMSAEDIISLKNMEKAVDRIYNSGAFSRTLHHLSAQNDPYEMFFNMGQALADAEKDGPVSRLGLYEFLLKLCGDEIKKDLTIDFLENNRKAPLPEALSDDIKNFKELHKMMVKLPQYEGKKLRLVAAANSFFAVSENGVEEVTPLIKSLGQ